MAFVLLAVVLIQVAVVVAYREFSTATRYTNSWAVEIREGGSEAADTLAHKYGFENYGQVGSLEGFYHFFLPKQNYTAQRKEIGEHFNQVTQMILREKKVGVVEQQVVRKRVRKSYSPPTDPNWSDQWSLLNTGQLGLPGVGHDLNVEPVWIQGVTGCNSIVAIVDDGVEYTHPDLQANYVGNLGYDYVDNDSSPFPAESSGQRDDHGTGCAGEIAMVKNNNVCGVGVAYHSSITGLRILGDDDQTDLVEARALGHGYNVISVYSNSWGPFDYGFTVEGPGHLVQRTFQTGAKKGRSGKGSIYVWAAGNGGEEGDSCAADGYASSIYTIAIGAASSNGSQASYDEDCAGKMAVAFVTNSFDEENLHITTTSARGRCTNTFQGTSASTPLAAAAIALMLEVNSNLTWRDVQYLIAYTSNPDILSGGDWVTNGAGLRVSSQFGFGALDAEALVTRARRWITVPEQQVDTVTPSQTNGDVSPGTSLNITFTYSGSIQFLEHVVVTISLGFEGVMDYASDPYFYYYLYEYLDYYYSEVEPNRGDIQIELTSPFGTTSILMPYRNRDTFPGSFTNWPLMSVHYWGEDPRGQWTLTIRYRGATNVTTLSGLNVTFYGTTETPAAVQRIPAQCDVACRRGCAAAGPEFCDACTHLRNASTLECISECSPGYMERSGYCYDPTVPEAQCIRLPVNITQDESANTALSCMSSLLVLTISLLYSLSQQC